jgi:hypothetical protein
MALKNSFLPKKKANNLYEGFYLFIYLFIY